MPAEDRNHGALDGLRIIEYSSVISAAYCGKLLADMGAEVIKVEPARRGDPTRSLAPFLNDDPGPDRSLLFGYLNTNKLGVTLDLTKPASHEWLHALIETADVLIVGVDVADITKRALTYEGLHDRHPNLVVVYVTPFGLTGPTAHFRGGELVAFQMSALGCLTPAGADISTQLPPLKVGGYNAQMVAGVSAAVAVMHALFARQTSGGGGHCADVSEFEAIASFQFMNMARWVYAGDPMKRPRARPGLRIKCRDGHVAVMFSQEHQWGAWVQVMEHPEWAADSRFATRADRQQNAAELVRLIEAWAADHTAEELYRAGQARRVPIFPLNTVADAVDSAQVQSRGFIRELPIASGDVVLGPSAPYQWSQTPWEVRQRAPQLGEHNREVFSDRLGMSPAVLSAAYEAGVI